MFLKNSLSNTYMSCTLQCLGESEDWMSFFWRPSKARNIGKRNSSRHMTYNPRSVNTELNRLPKNAQKRFGVHSNTVPPNLRVQLVWMIDLSVTWAPDAANRMVIPVKQYWGKSSLFFTTIDAYSSRVFNVVVVIDFLTKYLNLLAHPNQVKE